MRYFVEFVNPQAFGAGRRTIACGPRRERSGGAAAWARWKKSRLSVIVPILSIMASAPARAQEPNESYYMTIFSAQPESRDLRLTHSFATFVKASGTGDSAKDYQTEFHTISWMPQSLNIVVARLRPEPGTNLDLPSSLRWAESRNCRVSMWGPYQIDKELYDRAIKQEARLRSGRVLYKSLDRRFRPGFASNCIHAVRDLDTDRGLLRSGQGRGDEASYQVAQHLRRWIIDPGQTHAWVASRLDLNDHPVNGRDLEQRSLLASR
jgi:hypothetical protein